MDCNETSRKTHHRRFLQKKENYPNGYVEDCSTDLSTSSPVGAHITSIHTKSNKQSFLRPISHQNLKLIDEKQKSKRNNIDKSLIQKKENLDEFKIKWELSEKSKKEESVKNIEPSTENKSYQITDEEKTNNEPPSDKFKEEKKFTPVSMILLIRNTTSVNKDGSYDLRFDTGMIEGNGITVNEKGNEINFEEEGSYRFELSGEAVPFSDVDVKLVFHSPSFDNDIKPFTEINVPKDNGKLSLRGLTTILPIQKGQIITSRLIPNPDEKIIIMSDTRLLIHRVA